MDAEVLPLQYELVDPRLRVHDAALYSAMALLELELDRKLVAQFLNLLELVPQLLPDKAAGGGGLLDLFFRG